MTPLLATALIVHVLGGILAIGFQYVVLLHLLKREPNYGFVLKMAWSVAILFLISWGTSAFYYVTYYGTVVKPKILAGTMPIAHKFFMEAKEHIFLLLPFMAISIAVSVAYLRRNPDESLRKSTAILTLIAFIIGLAVTISGMVVSGSV